MATWKPHYLCGISIHALLTESDLIFPPVDTSSVSISIHALLTESDVGFGWNNNARSIFLSTLSLRRATKGSLHGGPVGIFLSTLSLRRATLVHITVDYCTNISIHALLTESDLETVQCYFADWFISIHALLTESDPMTERMVAGFEISIHALLTESDRGAPGLGQPDSNFYPRSPYGERLIFWQIDIE